MDRSVLHLSKKANAETAEHAGTKTFQMSATTITKNCAINIDHELGRSAGELSACWVYIRDKHGALVGGEGAAFIFTQDKRLVPMWQVIFYGGQTLERHQQLYRTITPYMNTKVRAKIKEAIAVDLVRERMTGTPPKDTLLGLIPSGIILDEMMDFKAHSMANYDDQLDAYKYAMTCALTGGSGAFKTSVTSDGKLLVEAMLSQTKSPDPCP